MYKASQYNKCVSPHITWSYVPDVVNIQVIHMPHLTTHHVLVSSILNHVCLLTGPQLQLRDIVLAIKEITDPYLLGINLGMEHCELKKIEGNHPQAVDRQMAEVIAYWQHDKADCSWEALASAVEKMGGHTNLVKTLRDKHKEAQKTAAAREV